MFEYVCYVVYTLITMVTTKIDFISTYIYGNEAVIFLGNDGLPVDSVDVAEIGVFLNANTSSQNVSQT